MNGVWEPWVSIAMARLVKPGMRCLDIGANVGYYSVLMAGLVEPFGHVDCVEASQRPFAILGDNLRVNGCRAQSWHFAASDQMERVTLYNGEWDIGCGTTERALLASAKIGEVREEPVEAYRCDVLLRGKMDFIKIDAEGMDYRALRGCQGLLGDRTVVMLEHFQTGFAEQYAQGREVRDGAARRLDEVLGMDYAFEGRQFRLHHANYDGYVEPLDREAVLAEPDRLWNLILMR